MFLNILAKRNWSLNLCLLYDLTVSLWFTNIEQITITPALFHYEKYLLQMQVSVVCIVWIGGEFYTSIKEWFATQLEPNVTLKQKLLCKNISFISWENKSEFWWVNMDGNAPCNYKKNPGDLLVIYLAPAACLICICCNEHRNKWNCKLHCWDLLRDVTCQKCTHVNSMSWSWQAI